MLASLIACGVEVRALTTREETLAPILLIAFTALVFGVRLTFRMARRSVSAIIRTQAGRERVTLRPAPEHAAAAVAAVAKRAGLEKPVRVLIVPRTSEILDAYADGGAGKSVLLISGGVALLARRSDPASRARFEALVLHECGHLLRNDSDVFEAIAAAVETAFAFLLVKIALLAAFGADGFADWYRILFPRSYVINQATQTIESVGAPCPSPESKRSAGCREKIAHADARSLPANHRPDLLRIPCCRP
jgi:Zn-dependent protease with chaperone function